MDIDRIPIDDLLLRRKGLRRQLSAADGLQAVRIAVLGGSTTNEVVDLLELFLLASGFRPEFYQSEYGRYYEEAVYNPAALIAFAPEIVYVHTSLVNLREMPHAGAAADDARAWVQSELGRFRQIWEAIGRHVPAQKHRSGHTEAGRAILFARYL